MKHLLGIALVALMLVLSGCGGGDEEPASDQTWQEEYAEEGYFFGQPAAELANELCEGDGVQQVVFTEEGLELVVCGDGEVVAP